MFIYLFMYVPEAFSAASLAYKVVAATVPSVGVNEIGVVEKEALSEEIS
jgi:hypothetical protein